MMLGEWRYGGVFAGNLVLEPCGPYPDMVYVSRDFKAIFFGLTFELAVSIPDATRILRERQIDHETGGDEFVFLKDTVLCGENIFISLMDKHDKLRDHVRLDSLRHLMELDNTGLGIEYVKEIRLGITDPESMHQWKTFIAEIIRQKNPVYTNYYKLGRGERIGRNAVIDVQRPMVVVGVFVNPGDRIVADSDCVVVFPREVAARVAQIAYMELVDDIPGRRKFYDSLGMEYDESVKDREEPAKFFNVWGCLKTLTVRNKRSESMPDS